MEDVTLKIDSEALVEVPVYEKDECGHNWLAVIEGWDRSAPGFLQRKFCKRASHPFYYMTEGLQRGQVIEFGADRVSLKSSRRNMKQPNRVYGVIQEVTAERLRFTLCPHVLTALALAESASFADARNPCRKPIRKFPIDTH